MFCGLDHKMFLIFVWTEIMEWSYSCLDLSHLRVALSNVGLLWNCLCSTEDHHTQDRS